MRPILRHGIIWSLTLLLMSGCSLMELGKTPETQFYSLSPATTPEASSATGLKLGIGPVKIPRMLNRPQLIIRTAQHQIQVLEEHQWGGSLKEDVAQTLVDNLSARLGTEQIEHFPWKRGFSPDYQVRVQIERMDGIPGGDITLKARWWIRKGNAPRDQRAEYSVYRVATKGNDYPAYVAALSHALEQLSEEITKAIRP